MVSKNIAGKEMFVKVCMQCGSDNVKPFSGDQNDVFGLNPKYECFNCGVVGMPVEKDFLHPFRGK